MEIPKEAVMSARLPRILYVEDSADDIELSRRVFQKSGLSSEIEIVQDGQAALNCMLGLGEYSDHPRCGDIKLILLDLKLPHIPGSEVLRQIKTNPRTRHIPVVVLSVTGKEREMLEKGPFRAELYLRKPLELHTFLNLYRDYVEGTEPKA